MIERKKTLNVFKDAHDAWGSFDDFPVGQPGTDPMPHLSRNRCAQPFFLVAEVVSRSDESTIEGKREIYKRHPGCECVLVIRQDRYGITVEHRAGEHWGKQTLAAPDERLNLAAFGLECRLSDIYKGTSVGTDQVSR